MEDVQHSIKPAEVRHQKVYNRLQFMELMLQIIIDTYNKKISPILHIEGHGSETDFSLPDGDKIPWSVIADIFSSLNKIMGNNLVTFIGCCHGFNFIKSISIMKFTPASYIISPYYEIESGVLEGEMRRFYILLFEFNDITKAKSILNANVMGFLDADKQFLKAITIYFQEKTRGTGWSERKEYLVSELIKSDKNWINFSEKEKSKRLKYYRKSLQEMRSDSTRRETYDFYSMRFLGYIRAEARQQVLDMLNNNPQQSNRRV